MVSQKKDVARNKDKMTKEVEKLEVDEYGDHEVSEFHNMPVPSFLKITYLIVTVVVFVWGIFFWQGSRGWFDRGHWADLQKAANTKTEKSIFWSERAVKRNESWRPGQ